MRNSGSQTQSEFNDSRIQPGMPVGMFPPGMFQHGMFPPGMNPCNISTVHEQNESESSNLEIKSENKSDVKGDDKIDSVENIYVQEFNNEIVTLKIKFLGNLDKIIRQLEKQNISLKLIGDQWSIQIS